MGMGALKRWPVAPDFPVPLHHLGNIRAPSVHQSGAGRVVGEHDSQARSGRKCDSRRERPPVVRGPGDKALVIVPGNVGLDEGQFCDHSFLFAHVEFERPHFVIPVIGGAEVS